MFPPVQTLQLGKFLLGIFGQTLWHKGKDFIVQTWSMAGCSRFLLPFFWWKSLVNFFTNTPFTKSSFFLHLLVVAPENVLFSEKHLFWRAMNLFWSSMLDFECVRLFFFSWMCFFSSTFHLYLICFSCNDINKRLPTHTHTKYAKRRQHENMTCNTKRDTSLNCDSFFG